MSKHQIIADGTGLHGRAIAAAVELMKETQPTTPDLGKVAEMLDISLDELQRIFPDEDALLLASLEQALIRLIDSCTKDVVHVDLDDSVGQFIALGDAYIRWAVTYPTQFRMLSDYQGLDLQNMPQVARYINSLMELMIKMLERARANGLVHPDEDIPLLVLSSRTYAYGLARLLVDGRMKTWCPGVEPLEAAQTAMRDFVHRMARGVQPLPQP